MFDRIESMLNAPRHFYNKRDPVSPKAFKVATPEDNPNLKSFQAQLRATLGSTQSSEMDDRTRAISFPLSQPRKLSLDLPFANQLAANQKTEMKHVTGRPRMGSF